MGYTYPFRYFNIGRAGNKSFVSITICSSTRSTTARQIEMCPFSVSINENSYFAKRYAARVETGKESYSDPVMEKISI